MIYMHEEYTARTANAEISESCKKFQSIGSLIHRISKLSKQHKLIQAKCYNYETDSCLGMGNLAVKILVEHVSYITSYPNCQQLECLESEIWVNYTANSKNCICWEKQTEVLCYKMAEKRDFNVASLSSF